MPFRNVDKIHQIRAISTLPNISECSNASHNSFDSLFQTFFLKLRPLEFSNKKRYSTCNPSKTIIAVRTIT